MRLLKADMRRRMLRLSQVNGKSQNKNNKRNNGKMTCKAISAILTAALAGVCTAGEDAEEGWAYAPGEGLSYGETPVMTAEFSLAFDSKYMTYGVIDGKDPILTPGATATFFDWAYIGVEAIYDLTKGNGKRGGYGNRAGKYTTLDAIAGIAHEFDLGETLGSLSVDANYIYEYIPTCRHVGDGCPDTQYLNLELGLGDLWFEPTLAIERDIMADEGTYVNFELGHTFTLVGDEEDAVLTFRPAVGQGFGNTQRVRGYFNKHPGSDEPLDHGGLMDTTIKGEFEWALCDWLSLGAYVAYYDYLFDSEMRDGARAHNSEWGDANHYANSYNFVCGLSLTATF